MERTALKDIASYLDREEYEKLSSGEEIIITDRDRIVSLTGSRDVGANTYIRIMSSSRNPIYSD